jgi:hypothetical protein
MSAQDYKWTVRKGNTARLAVQYQQLDGTPIPTIGATGALHVYDGDFEQIFSAANNGAGRFDIFLDVADITDFDFRQAEYEFNVTFSNNDVTTLVDGPLIVESGRGPFE